MQPRKVSGSDAAPALSGQISRVSISDLLSTLEGRGKSVVVRFQTPSGPASVWFAGGRLVDAEMGVLNGEPALYRILGLNQGTFEVSPEQTERPRVIQDPVSTLVAKRSKRAARWEDLVFGGPALDGIPTRGSNPPPLPSEVDDARLLRLIDGKRSLLEILDESRLDPVQALEVLGRLRQDGHFSIAGLASSRPPPPRPGPSPREPRIGRPDRISSPEITPPRTSTLVGLSAQAAPTSSPPSDGRTTPDPMPSNERQGVSTLIGTVDPSWLEPPLKRPPSNPPDSGPSISVENAPDESGLTETQLRAERERHARARARVASDWPRVEVAGDRPSSPPSPTAEARAPSEDTGRRSVPPSLAPMSSGLAIPGAVVGPYQVLFRLAQGPSSSVYLCREAENGSVRSLFALKLFEPRSEFEGTLDRFNDAARQVETLSHPNVTRLLGTGSFEGRPLLVSEYVDGCSFAALLKRYTKARPIPLLLAILFDAMRGLQAAHEVLTREGEPLRLVHGNLCPRDLLLGLDGVCRVSDIGASHALRSAGALDPGQDPSKLGYCSPERLLGRPLDARSDVFSLGAILYDALTGVEPFAAATSDGVRSRVQDHGVEPPSKVGLRPPPLFDEVCLRALSRDPEQRFQSVRDFLQALEAAAIEHDTLASSVEVAGWIAAAFGRELELRRLSILDASRRSRGNSRPPGSAPPPSVSVSIERSAPPPPSMPAQALELRRVRSPVVEPSALAIVPRVPPAALVPKFPEFELSEPSPPRRTFPTAIVLGLLLGIAAVAFLFYRSAVDRPSQPEAAQLTPAPEPKPEPAAQATALIPPPPSTATAVESSAAPARAPAGEVDTVDRAARRRIQAPRVRRSRAGEPPEAVVEDPAANPVETAPAEPKERPAGEAPATAPEPAPPPPPKEGGDSEFRYGI